MVSVLCFVPANHSSMWHAPGSWQGPRQISQPAFSSLWILAWWIPEDSACRKLSQSHNTYQQNSLFLLLQGFFSTGIADAVSYSLHTLCWSLNTGSSRRCLASFSKFQEYQHAGKRVFIKRETKTSFVLDRKTSATNVSEVNNAISRYALRTDAGAATSLQNTATLAACTMGQGTFLARTTGSFPFKRCT